MPVGILGSNQRSAQRYQASGEATEQAEVPTKFQSNPPASSPISAHLATPTDHTSFVPGQPNAVVKRWPRMDGMRYLYARGMIAMPIHPNGTSIPRPYISKYQRNSEGPIRNAGFNDRLYQAGYPGFNLGLSFKVPTVNRISNTTPGVKSHTPKHNATTVLNRIRRSSGAPKER